MSERFVLGQMFSIASLLGFVPQVWAETLPIVSTQARDLAPVNWSSLSQLLAQAPPQSPKPAPTSEDKSEDAVELDEVVVTGSARRRRQSETTTPVYVINQAEIEQKGARTLADAIRNVPGVTTNIFGAGSDVHNAHFIRGLPTTSTAILIDGRPITNLNQQHYDPGEIPVNNVERIEVMPSGGTTLYGSTALGGVINVITRKPTKALEGALSVEFGSYGYSKYGAYYQGKSDRLTYNFAYENFNTLNNFYYQVERPTGTLRGIRPNGDVNLRSYNFDVGYEFDARNTLTITSYLRNSSKGISPFSIIDTRENVYRGKSANELGLNDDHKSRLSTDTWGVALTYDSKLGLGDDSKLQFRISLDRSSNIELTPEGEDFRTGVYLLGLRGTHNWQLNPVWNLTYGFDYLKEIGTSQVFNLAAATNQVDYDTSLERPAVFFLNEINVASNVFMTAGARYSITREYGNSLDPNVGLRWQVAPNFALRTNFNQGFKAPNFDDLFGKTVHKGNPTLQPERGSFFDAGIDWQPTLTTSLRLTAFISDVRNLLTINLVDPRQPDFDFFSRVLGYVNGDRVRVSYPSVYNTGLEMSFNWKMNPSWEFFLTETYTDSRVIDGLRTEVSQTQQALVPFHMGRVGFAYEDPNGTRAALFANFAGGRSVDAYHVGPNDVEVEPGVFIPQAGKLPMGSLLPGYTTVDLSLRVPLGNALILNAYVDNLLGTYFERSYGGPAPGTNFKIGLTSKF